MMMNVNPMLTNTNLQGRTQSQGQAKYPETGGDRMRLTPW